MTATQPRFAPGSLVRARGRDWVVLPSNDPGLLLVRPITGSDDTPAGILLALEGADVHPTEFAPPDPAHAGDATGALLLCDAARLKLRDGAAPFRSLGHISVVPRPYQFVPLIMALRQETVRLLIADDVGVGKTIEAALIAREMLDRGLIRRIGVVCPAHLCDQWEQELSEKFGLQPAVIQPSRMARLERQLPRRDLSVYQYYPHLVASIDFVKAGPNRGHFLDNAPDLVIIDEAHTATRPGAASARAEQQRYELVRDLAKDPSRHLILVTATPHSGIEDNFRSLLGLLNPQFDAPPLGPEELDRNQLIPYLVQRSRPQLKPWLGESNPFPNLDATEKTYALSPEYRALFNDVLNYCKQTVTSGHGLGQQQQRVRHWAALALLRCVLSSPSAAEAVLGNRAKRTGVADTVSFETTDEVDAAYRPQVLDALEEEESGDYAPTAPIEQADILLTDVERQRLSGFVRRARDLSGSAQDRKLADLAAELSVLLRDGYRPIVFCRYIPTANYLAQELPALLRSFAGIHVVAVTGEIGDEARRARIAELVKSEPRVLVATDCLSEGINLQEHFDAVVHYDLPWNPNRLSQREGRIDRFGQRKKDVKAVLMWDPTNPIDQVVMEVLVRKARQIRQQWGLSVSVSMESDTVVQSVLERVLLGAPGAGAQLRMTGTGGGVQLQMDLATPEVSKFHAALDAAAEREGNQRAFFGQRGIQPEEVEAELRATDPVLGDSVAIQRFLAEASQRFNGSLAPTRNRAVFALDPGHLAASLRARGAGPFPLEVTFDRLQDEHALYLGRTSPLVEAFCTSVLGAGLGNADELFPRCGAIFTEAVVSRTAILLVRLRYILREVSDQFAEEVVLAAFERPDGDLFWLEPLEAASRDLLQKARPAANMPAAERANHVREIVDLLNSTPGWSEPLIERRTIQLQESHSRLRRLARSKGLEVRPHQPPDILGCYVLVPVGAQ